MKVRKISNLKNVNTPYDDTFRTLQYDCPELIIPMINEIFHEDYVGDEKIFEKKLLFLIPFYIFCYEHEFEEIVKFETKK